MTSMPFLDPTVDRLSNTMEKIGWCRGAREEDVRDARDRPALFELELNLEIGTQRLPRRSGRACVEGMKTVVQLHPPVVYSRAYGKLERNSRDRILDVCIPQWLTWSTFGPLSGQRV